MSDLNTRFEEITEKIERLKEERNAMLRESLAVAPEAKLGSDAMVNSLLLGLEGGEPEAISVRRFTTLAQGDSPMSRGKENVEFVAVRMAGEKETYLGLYLGEIARGVSIRYDPRLECLGFSYDYHNPAILIPALRRIVFGSESWWRAIRSPEDLKYNRIRDEDIQRFHTFVTSFLEAVDRPSENQP